MSSVRIFVFHFTVPILIVLFVGFAGNAVGGPDWIYYVAGLTLWLIAFTLLRPRP